MGERKGAPPPTSACGANEDRADGADSVTISPVDTGVPSGLTTTSATAAGGGIYDSDNSDDL